MTHIVWAQEKQGRELDRVGGKGANLGEMTHAGLPVPPAFTVTADAFQVFIDEADLASKIEAVLEELDVEDNEQLTQASQDIQEIILEAAVPKEIEEAIREAYQEMSPDDDAHVAVRSSATAEDLPDASFAGQQETFLHVEGADSVVEHVRRCWASLYTPRAIYYRVNKGFEHGGVQMGVVVQRMVEAEISGVLFTRHPTTGEPKVIIEAAWGLGEGVVSGQVSPDNYVVDADGKLLDETIATKKTMVVPGEEGTGVREVDVPKEQQDQRVLDDDQIAQLTRLATTLDKHYDAPQDVEWAFEDGELYVLQTRPITTIDEERVARLDETDDGDGEPDVLLKGLGASPGAGAGSVVHVSSAQELDKCKEGDILVTTMTTPDMVPAMKRASAIVTDEGGMTCFPAGTRVLTDKGLVPIEEIPAHLSDEELSALSIDPETLEMSWQPVLASMERRAEVMEISVSQRNRATSDTLRLTPDHKMMILEGDRLAERQIQEVLAQEEMLTVADRIPGLAGEAGWPIAPYLAGAIFTDGHWRLAGTKGAVEFIQNGSTEKLCFLETVRENREKAFGPPVGQRWVTGTSTIRGHTFESTSSRLYVQRRKAAEAVESLWTDLHHHVLTGSEEELLDFLAGVTDGDGTFQGDQGTRIQIYTGDDHLAQAIVLACLRLGIQPTISPNRGSCRNIQIRERLGDILARSTRHDPPTRMRAQDSRLLAARQVLGDRVDEVNPGGKIRPYVEGNLLLGQDKLDKALEAVEDPELRGRLEGVLDAPIRNKRVHKIREVGVEPVYNLTVAQNHNYVVFTDQLTPVLVANCHAAIVSRELGIPSVVGTKTGTQVLEEGLEVTVHGDRGTVSKGITVSETEDTGTQATTTTAGGPGKPVTATEVKVNISMPEATERARATDADGVGLLRIEHIVLGLGEHPMEFLEGGREDEYIDYLVKNIRKVAEAFYPRPVWVRTLDAPTDEFREMPGGDREPDEANPMLGWRGIRRSLEQTELLEAEFTAIKRLHEEGSTNVGIMMPLVQSPQEIRQAKAIARSVGLDPDDPDLAFGIMIEIPAAALTIDDLLDEGLDFVSFGTNDLTQYTLAVDRNNQNVAPLFSEFHPAIGKLVKMVIEACQERGVQSSICGQAGSDPRFVKKLIEWGITSVSANIDAVAQVRETVARVEQKLLLDAVREGR